MKDFSLICPRNDGEALTIVKLAMELGIDVRISPQPWGATLDREPQENLQNLKKTIMVVEMPSVETEEALRRAGHDVIVIDHHNYVGMRLDRSNKLSSLEQFAALIDHQLSRWEKGVAINDRAYIPGLLETGYEMTEILGIRMMDLEAQGATRGDFALCAEALEKAEVKNGTTVVWVDTRKSMYVNDLFALQDPTTVRDILVCMEGEIRFCGDREKVGALSVLGGWVAGNGGLWGSDDFEYAQVFEILGIKK